MFKKHYDIIMGGASSFLGALITIFLGLQHSYLTFALSMGFFTSYFILLFYFIKNEVCKKS